VAEVEASLDAKAGPADHTDERRLPERAARAVASARALAA
jgi:hypothetical protein